MCDDDDQNFEAEETTKNSKNIFYEIRQAGSNDKMGENFNDLNVRRAYVVVEKNEVS